MTANVPVVPAPRPAPVVRVPQPAPVVPAPQQEPAVPVQVPPVLAHPVRALRVLPVVRAAETVRLRA